jgi:hypothetical protein
MEARRGEGEGRRVEGAPKRAPGRAGTRARVIPGGGWGAGPRWGKRRVQKEKRKAGDNVGPRYGGARRQGMRRGAGAVGARCAASPAPTPPPAAGPRPPRRHATPNRARERNGQARGGREAAVRARARGGTRRPPVGRPPARPGPGARPGRAAAPPRRGGRRSGGRGAPPRGALSSAGLRAGLCGSSPWAAGRVPCAGFRPGREVRWGGGRRVRACASSGVGRRKP